MKAAGMTIEPCFINIQERILKLLGTAEHTIHIAMAWLTDKKIIDLLHRQAGAGLVIFVLLLDDTTNKANQLLTKKLPEVGAQVHFIGSGTELLHHKFCVIDCKTVITGSYNWTNNAKTNHENIIVIEDYKALATTFLIELYNLYGRYIHHRDTWEKITPLIEKSLSSHDLPKAPELKWEDIKDLF